jgi:hypothetical protein
METCPRSPSGGDRGRLPNLAPVTQRHRGDAGGDIETGIALDADRLQRDRAVGAADQNIGADPDADRGAAGGADIIAGERTRPQAGGRREHCPDDHGALRVAYVDAEFRDRAGIVLAEAGMRERATHRPRRAEDKAPAAGDIAGQGADRDTGGLRLRHASKAPPATE